ncbi:MAG: energy transducer TonB [Bacteroidota bacterium]
MMKKLILLLWLMLGHLSYSLAQDIPADWSTSDEIIRVPEDPPRFTGCEYITDDRSERHQCAQEAAKSFIQENLQYPAKAYDHGIEGTVVVTFVIEKDGSITDPKLIYGLEEYFGEEALRLISIMPNWIPGRRRGLVVRTQFNLPIKFKLD